MLSAEQLRAALKAARGQCLSGGGTVVDALIRTIPQVDRWLEPLTRHAGVVGLLSPHGYEPDFSQLKPALAQQLRAVVVQSAASDGVCLAMADPWSETDVRKACQVLGQTPTIVAVSGQCLGAWLGDDWGPPQSVSVEKAGRRAGGSPVPSQELASLGASDDPQNVRPGVGEGVTGPVVDFVDSAIRAAFAAGASDIHFECSRTAVQVRLRQDGVMTAWARLEDSRRAQEVISRIKVMAQLDITERRTPQDGRFRFDPGDGSVDLRVSIMPSVFGEDAVLRLLDKAQLRSQQQSVSLDLLGFDAASRDRIRDLAQLPHGMLLVTGPTGSGKTTTVYAVLSEVNTGLEKIITIEDPVEYELAGVLQIPVNERKGLTFAKGLRSILRHDPDRILVGEIRDAETAEIAVQSALTGHQVFTTVHANSIFDVTGRFRHFGLDMFGFMSSLNGVIVQRLVRRLCVHCSARRPADERERRWLASQSMDAPASGLPRPVGCPHCHDTGYSGRFVIAQVHAVTDALRDLVTSQAPVSALREMVASQGVLTLGQQGAQLVVAGQTSAEEIKRVVGWQ